MSGIMPVIIILVFVLGASLRLLREYERGVIFRLGKLARSVFNPGGDGTGPGLLIVIPFVDKMAKVRLRTIAMDVPPQDVTTVQIKHVDLPPEMIRAMAKQAEAERQRRAKIIHADREFRAAAKLSEAAEVLGRFPTAVQLRFLQTMGELAPLSG